MPQKIVIIQELFSSYREPIFDRLSLKYELAVLHGKKKSDLKLIEKAYSVRIEPYYILRGRFVFLNVFGALRRIRPRAVIHQGSPGILSLPLTWLWCKFNNTGFIIWTHGFERHQGFNPKRSFRSWLRQLYFNMADSVLFYTKERRDFFNRILPGNKLFYATNTLDTQKLLKLRDRFALMDLDMLKKDLSMDDHFNMVFIGRLLSEKLPDHLIYVTQSLKNKGVKIKTHIIGDGEELSALKKLSREQGMEEDVLFYGAVYDDLFSGKILFSSDVMVIPGYVGLAINHAYCFNLPVVTYQQGIRGPFHSPEIDYLEKGKTGLMTKAYDVEEMSRVLFDLIHQPDLLRSLKLNVNRKMDELNIERMESGFCECIDYTIGEKK